MVFILFIKLQANEMITTPCKYQQNINHNFLYIGSKYLYSRNLIMLFIFLYNVEKLSDTIELGSK